MSFIIKDNFESDLYGISGVAAGQNWAATGMRLMNKMWELVKAHKLANKGLNVWVYEEGNKMFTGVELISPPPEDIGLELKKVRLQQYAYFKHIGPYDRIGAAGSDIRKEMDLKGIKTGLPYLEIYGHWTADETKLETDLLWRLE